MPPSDRDILAALYDAGAIYDSRRSGSMRTLHLSRYEGSCHARWCNGPFDCHRVEVTAATPVGAVTALVDVIEEINVSDGEETAAE